MILTNRARLFRCARSSVLLLFVATLVGPALADETIAPIAPITLEEPGLLVAGLPTELTVTGADTLPAGRHRVVLRDGSGAKLAEGSVAAGEAAVLSVSGLPAGWQQITAAVPDLSQQAVRLDVRAIPGWMTLLPPLIAIGFALVTRQVLPSLFLGIWAGAWVFEAGPFAGLLRALDRYLIQALLDGDRISIVVFSLMLGGMVGVLSRSGGTVGLVERLAPYATSRRRGQLVTWIMGILIFFDDYANSLLVGNTMRPVTDRLKVSREKLAYIVDSTAAPVASIALVSTWIGYEVSLIGTSLENIGSPLEPYSVFIRSLPYNFYPLLALLFGLLVAVTRRDFGPMLAAESRAAGGEVLRPGATPLSDFDSAALLPPDGAPRRWLNAVLPIGVVLIVTFYSLWATGRSALDPTYDREAASWIQYVGDVFSGGSSFKALLWASFAGSVTAIALAVSQRILSIHKSVEAWVNGLRSMTMAILILVLAWGIADVCAAVNTRGYLVATLSDGLDPRWLPVLIFILSSLTAFATGSSWGTMGILIPLAVPTAHGVAEAAAMGTAAEGILLCSVSSVLAGAIFGDHCSPISDTTVLSSMATGCDHVDHVRTQLPYALGVAGVAILAGYVPAGFGISPWLCLPVGAACCAGLIFGLGRRHQI